MAAAPAELAPGVAPQHPHGPGAVGRAAVAQLAVAAVAPAERHVGLGDGAGVLESEPDLPIAAVTRHPHRGAVHEVALAVLSRSAVAYLAPGIPAPAVDQAVRGDAAGM